MKQFIAIYGNGQRYIFNAYNKSQATAYASQFGMQNRLGMLCNVLPA